MDFLFSNLPPLKTRAMTFYDSFYENLSQAAEVDIAVGYITADSLSELQNTIIQNNSEKKLNLVIGMHYFDKKCEK